MNTLEKLILVGVFLLLPAFVLAQTSMSGSAGAGVSSGYSGSGYVCTKEYRPVCGARQVQCVTAPCYPMYETFGNRCELNGEGAVYLHEGECLPHESGPVIGYPEPTKPYEPPATCTAWYDGCNSCGRGPNGQIMCTLRACLGAPSPGYCTAYGSATNPPVVSNPDEPVSSDDGVVVTNPSQGMPNAPGSPGVEVGADISVGSIVSFFVRAWTGFFSWFGF